MTGWRVTGILIAASILPALTACSSGVAGQPTGPPTRTGSSSSAPQQAPRVTDPIDVSKFLASPCTALTDGQLSELGVANPVGDPSSDQNGTGCSWTGETGATFGLSWLTGNKHGLADLYTKRSTFAYWQPTTVAGYPAAYGDPLIDRRAQGSCTINVGVSDSLSFFMNVQTGSDNAAQDCRLAARAAADVIGTTKKG